MANLNVVLSGATLQVVNTADSTVRVNSSLSSPSLPAAESSYSDFLPILAAGSIMTLPAATIWALAIRNLGGINGTPAGNITVCIQATGGALAAQVNSPIVLPNGVYIYWNTAETAGGIVAVTLFASVNLTPVEILMSA